MTAAEPGTDPWTHAPLGAGVAGGDIASARLAAGEQPAAGLVDRRGVVDPVRPMVPLGQLRDTFIVAIDSEGLLIVDQHVAHERILYEQVLERLTSRALESQRLLTPLVLELSPAQVEALGARGEDLARLGFEVEPFGDRTVHVAAVPSIVKVEAAAAAIRALADDLDGRDRGAPVEVAVKHLAATIACHAAVKAHDPLTHREDAVPARRAAPHRLLDDLPARASGAAAPHAPRDRTRLRSRLIANLQLLGARSGTRAVFDWCTRSARGGCARAHKSARFCLTPRSRRRSVRTLQRDGRTRGPRAASPATSELDRPLGDPRDACPAAASRADGCL